MVFFLLGFLVCLACLSLHPERYSCGNYQYIINPCRIKEWPGNELVFICFNAFFRNPQNGFLYRFSYGCGTWQALTPDVVSTSANMSSRARLAASSSDFPSFLYLSNFLENSSSPSPLTIFLKVSFEGYLPSLRCMTGIAVFTTGCDGAHSLLSSYISHSSSNDWVAPSAHLRCKIKWLLAVSIALLPA